MKFRSLFFFVLAPFLLAGPYSHAQEETVESPERPASLSIEPIPLSPNAAGKLPYLIEVEGSSQDETLPEEPKTKPLEVDVRGKGNYEIFQLAGEAYDGDELETAAAYYHALLDRGVRHGDVYFNLANTYFRMSDRFGWAVLFYEKALRLRPRDADIRHNLDYARTFLIDEPPKRPVSAMDTLLILHRQTTLNETFWLLAIVNLLFVALLAARTLNLKFSHGVYYGYLRGVVVTLFLLQVASAAGQVRERGNLREGVILADSIRAKAAPTSEETLIELNSGTKVEILDTRSGYAHIRLPDGTPAFIPKTEIGEI